MGENNYRKDTNCVHQLINKFSWETYPKALRNGKSLQMSGHVEAVQYRGISENVPYCVVKAKVTRETSLNLEPYSSWIIVHKEKGVLVEAYCTCPAG